MDELLWKRCGDWLCQLQVLPPKHTLSNIEDLVYTLRDGVILCNILATLDPASVDIKQVNQRPQMARCLCLKNIRIFLSACKNSFGLKDSELFEPSMLYDFTDFGRVVHSLSKLSKSQRVRLLSKLNGFPPTNAATRARPEEEQIYQRLEDLVSDDTYEQFYYSHHGGGTSNYAYCNLDAAVTDVKRREPFYTPSSRDEDIYSDLCNLRRDLSSSHHAANKVSGGSSSSSVTLTPSVSRLSLLQAEWKFEPVDGAGHCLKELVETEANYVDCLNMLRKNFIKTIRKMKDSDKKIVFMNIKDLGESHGAFYTNLVESVTGKTHKKIGDIFLEYKERFLKYGDYCSDLPKAQERLAQLYEKDEAVRNEIIECEESANEGKFQLRGLLVVPMQRILKYHLLLGQLAKSQGNDDPQHFRAAHEAMLDVADFVNEVKRDSEHLQVVQEIQTSITDWNMPEGIELKNYGRMRKDGELKVQSHDASLTGGAGKPKLRYMFVFDKILLTCKPTKADHYSYKDSLKLSDYKVQDPGSGNASNAASTLSLTSGSSTTSRLGVIRRDSTRWSHSFLLVHTMQLNAFTFYARTADDKKKWMEAISEALNTVTPVQRLNSSHDPVMHSFDRPTHCQSCQKLLKGLFYQGYQCTKCFAPSHRQCIPALPNCGMLFPPELPPRPPSMPLPTLQDPNRFSNSSLEESPVHPRQWSVASLPPTFNTINNNNHKSSLQADVMPTIPPPPQSPSLGNLNGSHPDYVNTRMEDHPWFVGEMDRESANQTLARYPPGTFLVRRRVVDREFVGYALSLRTDGDVKHMKINSSAESPLGNSLTHLESWSDSRQSSGASTASSTDYYLADSRKFKSIMELVYWYSQHSLRECFNCLDTNLSFSIGELTIMEAKYEFSPTPDHRNMLPLRVGDKVTIIDRSGETTGWWKACLGHRIGYIPKDFVIAVE